IPQKDCAKVITNDCSIAVRYCHPILRPALKLVILYNFRLCDYCILHANGSSLCKRIYQLSFRVGLCSACGDQFKVRRAKRESEEAGHLLVGEIGIVCDDDATDAACKPQRQMFVLAG